MLARFAVEQDQVRRVTGQLRRVDNALMECSAGMLVHQRASNGVPSSIRATPPAPPATVIRPPRAST